MKRSFDTETSEKLIDYYYKNLLVREEIYFLTICRNISLINSILRHEEKTCLFFVSLLSGFFFSLFLCFFEANHAVIRGTQVGLKDNNLFLSSVAILSFSVTLNPIENGGGGVQKDPLPVFLL